MSSKHWWKVVLCKQFFLTQNKLSFQFSFFCELLKSCLWGHMNACPPPEGTDSLERSAGYCPFPPQTFQTTPLNGLPLLRKCSRGFQSSGIWERRCRGYGGVCFLSAACFPDNHLSLLPSTPGWPKSPLGAGLLGASTWLPPQPFLLGFLFNPQVPAATAVVPHTLLGLPHACLSFPWPDCSDSLKLQHTSWGMAPFSPW